MNSILTWLASVYSESDGHGSSTRVNIALIIGFILGIGISFAVSVHHRLITVEQFNSFLAAGGTFIVTVCGTLYGLNRLAGVADAKVANKPEQT